MYTTKKGSSKLQAHRGVSTEYPENTMPAFIASVEQGYDIIELDPGYTKDGEIIILHDQILNRTVRNADGSEIKEKTYAHKCTLEELLKLDAGIWFSDEFKGVKIPTFEDVLKLSAENNMPLKIDNKVQRFYPEEIEKMIGLIKKYGAEKLVGFTCTDLYFIDYIMSVLPNVTIHYDGYADKWHLEEVRKSIKDNNLVIWHRYDNETSAWCKIPPVNEETVKLSKEYGEIGLWILSENEEADVAVDKFSADYIETTGSIKPVK